MTDNRLIFEKSFKGKNKYELPCWEEENKIEDMIPASMLREELPNLPEVSEIEAVRHYTSLSNKNFGVDSGFYPLGSCTMKYNPKINEKIAGYDGFLNIHPLQPQNTVQGCLEVIYELDSMLCEITGMSRFTMQPAAGAHGELTGLMIMKAYHEHNNQSKRKKILIPDSAHGTNPASASAAGFEVVTVLSDDEGNVDLDSLKKAAGEDVAGLMLTNPSTLGLFEKNIEKIAQIVHDCGGLLYYDGANANAILGVVRPGDMGFDVVHLNLHKTFSTPHGGGGPGSGPVGVIDTLVDFLPDPIVEKENDNYVFKQVGDKTIGRVKDFYGNFNVMLKAYTYIRALGANGLRDVAKTAVLNANYIMNRLKDVYDIPYDRICMHEFVVSATLQKENGVTALDIAKRLIDYGVHPPTIYFPLIVKEALMIEPTETESKESLDNFIEVMRKIAEEAEKNPDKVRNAPENTFISRLDETTAARKPVLRYKC